MKIFNPSLETEVHCDTSKYGFGAALLQKQSDGVFHPVMFYSSRTTQSEQKYHSFELETVAIVNALRRFHPYVFGTKFKVMTDCNSLALTLKKKDINPRMWLQNYDGKRYFI